MTTLLSKAVVPVASVDDAEATASSLSAHDVEVGSVTLVYVVEKAGGSPDKASVEQREEMAQKAFDAFHAVLPDAVADRRITYDTDVVDGISSVADEIDATAIVFTAREGGRLVRLLTGDVAYRLTTDADRPVVSLPRHVDE